MYLPDHYLWTKEIQYMPYLLKEWSLSALLKTKTTVILDGILYTYVVAFLNSMGYSLTICVMCILGSLSTAEIYILVAF